MRLVGILLAAGFCAGIVVDQGLSRASVSLEPSGQHATVLSSAKDQEGQRASLASQADAPHLPPPTAQSSTEETQMPLLAEEGRRFRARLEKRWFGRLGVRYWDEYLKLCLRDPAVLSLFENWFLEQGRTHGEDMVYLRAIAESIVRTQPDLLEPLLERAIAEENWRATAALLSQVPRSMVGSPGLDQAFDSAIKSEDEYAQFYALSALYTTEALKNSPNLLSTVKELFDQNASNPSIAAMSAFALGETDVLDTQESYDRLFERATNASDPTSRYVAFKGGLLALGQCWTGDNNVSIGLARLSTMLDWIGIALDDPDPFVRYSAVIDHMLVAEQIQILATMYVGGIK